MFDYVNVDNHVWVCIVVMCGWIRRRGGRDIGDGYIDFHFKLTIHFISLLLPLHSENILSLSPPFPISKWMGRSEKFIYFIFSFFFSPLLFSSSSDIAFDGILFKAMNIEWRRMEERKVLTESFFTFMLCLTLMKKKIWFELKSARQKKRAEWREGKKNLAKNISIIKFHFRRFFLAPFFFLFRSPLNILSNDANKFFYGLTFS